MGNPLATIVMLGSVACVIPALAEDLAALERQLSAAEAKLAAIEEDAARARQEVRRLKQAVDAARGDGQVAPAAPPPPAPAGQVDPSAAKAAPARIYRSLVDVLREMPDAAKPHPVTGWDKYSKVKAQDWLEKGISGKALELNLELSGVKVSHNGFGPPGREWRVVLTFKDETHPFLGQEVVTRVGGLFNQLNLAADEASARRIEKLPPGLRLKIRGDLKKIAFAPNSRDRHQVLWPEFDGKLTIDHPAFRE